MNTIRTCLYRDLTGKFKVINNSIRFGIDGGLDNETGGGQFVTWMKMAYLMIMLLINIVINL